MLLSGKNVVDSPVCLSITIFPESYSSAANKESYQQVIEFKFSIEFFNIKKTEST